MTFSDSSPAQLPPTPPPQGDTLNVFGVSLRPWMWKLAAACFALYLFVLIGLYMAVAGRVVQYSYTISGPEVMTGSSPNAMRVGVRDVYKERFLPGALVRVDLVDPSVADPKTAKPEQLQTLYEGVTSPAGFADVRVDLPHIDAKRVHFKVRVDPRQHDAATVDVAFDFKANSPPDLVRPWADAAGHTPDKDEGKDDAKPAKIKITKEPGQGPLLLELFPDGGAPIDALPSRYFVRALDRATRKPVAAEVDVSVVKGVPVEGFPKRVKTDEGGLAWFTVTPVGSHKWSLSSPKTTERDASTRELIIESEKRQHSIVASSPVWADTWRIPVHTLRERGALYADLYLEDRWVLSDVTGLGQGGGGFEWREAPLQPPAKSIWIAHLQTYTQPLAPGVAIDVRKVIIPGKDVDRRDILTRVLERAWGSGLDPETARAIRSSSFSKNAPLKTLDAHTAFWLSRLSHTPKPPRLVLDTQQLDSDALASDKEAWRAPVTTLLTVSSVFAVLLIFSLVAFNLLKVRAHSRAVLQELADEGVELDASLLSNRTSSQNPQTRTLARMEALFQMAVILTTIALFFVAIIVLLQHL